ncbi:MAG: NAD(P)-binding protein [Candidatus Melainabacteria bacterium]|jgi:2-polyprenyl-6-methoxyphenol hydroxylase-like FAD-dependent oxidoreductase|nr:NAD(P)-binding protein [Candidatus Melainabacteria bacterium]
MTAKILIVGAGPSGLTLALELARQGIQIDIIDQKAEPSTLSRAVGILPITMKLLGPSGAAALIAKQSIVIENAVFYDKTRKITRLALDQMKDPQERMFSLPQDRTESILRDLLQEHDITVRYHSELTSLEQTDEQVTVSINGETQSYDYVIGADGVKSPCRELAGIDFPGYELDEHWSIADVYIDNARYSRDFNIHLNGHGQVILIIPLEAKRIRIISNTDDALHNLPAALKVREIKRTGKFRIGIHQASEYQKGRIFLVGDAAHCHSPVGGRGMNLGIADAVDLASRFVDGGLENYHSHRHPIAAKVIASTERARKIMLSSNWFSRSLALLFLRFVSKIGFLNKFFLEKVVLAGDTV